MGLSDEERMTKTYWALLGWRQKFAKLHEEMLRPRSLLNVEHKEAALIVENWLAKIDEITGKLIASTNFNSAYWFIGSNENSFRCLWEDQCDLAIINDEVLPTARYGSLWWYLENFDAVDLARRLTAGSQVSNYETDGAAIIGTFWDAFRYVDSILYSVNRYNDALFDPIKKDLISLFGQMANMRYLLMTSHCEEDITQRRNIEQALLCKFRVVSDMLDKKRCELNENQNRDEWVKMVFEEGFDIESLIEDVRKMSLSDVKSYLDKVRDDKYEKEREHDKKSEKEKDPLNGLFGPSPRSQQELEDILDAATTEAEYENARKELGSVYSTYVCSWDTKKEAIKKRANKKAVIKNTRKAAKKR